MAAMEGGEDKKEGGDGGAEDDDDDLMYGAPDDHAWTDKSHAHKEAEEKSKEGPDMSVSWFGYLYASPCAHLITRFDCILTSAFCFTLLRAYMRFPAANLLQGRQKAQ